MLPAKQISTLQCEFVIVVQIFVDGPLTITLPSEGRKGRDKENKSQANDLAYILGARHDKEVDEAEVGKRNNGTVTGADKADEDVEDDEDEVDDEDDGEDDEEDGQAVPGRHCLIEEWVRTIEILAHEEVVCKEITEEAIDEF